MPATTPRAVGRSSSTGPHHRDPAVVVRVCTSVARGQAFARRRGADAIRIFVFRDDGRSSRGVAKTVRVFRADTVEGVLDRVRERAREAYAAANEYVKRHPGARAPSPRPAPAAAPAAAHEARNGCPGHVDDEPAPNFGI